MTEPASPDTNWPDDLPVLTEVVSAAAPDDLPLLTEVVSAAPEAPEPATPAPEMLSAQDRQQILAQLEAHLDTVVAEKLRQHLEQLQEQAIAQTLGELKAGLPVLLQEALNAHLKSG